MSRNTMSFALPESLRDYIEARVRSGGYGNTSEYLRDLIRRDQQEQAAATAAGTDHRRAGVGTRGAGDEAQDR